MTYRKILLLLSIGFLLALAACGDSVEEKIYQHLEKAVTLEDDFEKQQDPMTELEKQEHELYNKIIDLNMDEFDKIKDLSQQAITIIEDRQDRIGIEMESIEASKEEILKTKDLIAEIKDEQVKEKAEAMYDTMMKRFEAYETLNSSYEESLKQEKELYTMLQQEDVEQNELTSHINTINESYGKIIEANETFNAHTAEYNELKKKFYDISGIDVTYEEEAAEKPKQNEEKDKE